VCNVVVVFLLLLPVAKSLSSCGSQRDFHVEIVCVCVCVYLGEFICILDGAIMIYNKYLLHVYIDNMYF
jgi:hypothetical protein